MRLARAGHSLRSVSKSRRTSVWSCSLPEWTPKCLDMLFAAKTAFPKRIVFLHVGSEVFFTEHRNPTEKPPAVCWTTWPLSSPPKISSVQIKMLKCRKTSKVIYQFSIPRIENQNEGEYGCQWALDSQPPYALLQHIQSNIHVKRTAWSAPNASEEDLGTLASSAPSANIACITNITACITTQHHQHCQHHPQGTREQ